MSIGVLCNIKARSIHFPSPEKGLVFWDSAGIMAKLSSRVS
ncbi:hypothetical protein Pogu_0016 [Pyrobaculum oguniense TE7]|uniref:Uncharacterized protein n=1 Tax=Pyrobaculum oguniense (strain DSM 13380 / JCM 10595 / TE7) TaxID=698757 RepID=H6Q613_PYROT|nr:hypothetical protein Pogu_0016 [Pyrobaculum oguniense TE7]